LISWIKGEIIDTWLKNKKFYVLLNCNGLGYEIQGLDSLKNYLEKESITLWIKQIKREDSDFLFGFKKREERDFFSDLIQIKGIGPQIGMSLLNKHNYNEIIDSIKNQNKTFFSNIPGIGQKMTERIIFELNNKLLTLSKANDQNLIKTDLNPLNKEIQTVIEDLDLALKSLSYSQKERKETISLISKKIHKEKITEKNMTKILNFEKLLKDALGYLAKN